MTKSPSDAVWPEKLRLRDTGLTDDMGGGGQRIYTTAGRGYDTHEYIRADVLFDKLGKALEHFVTELEQITKDYKL